MYPIEEYEKHTSTVNRIGFIAICLFRQAGADYAKFYFPNEEEFVNFYNQDYAVWLAGIAVTPEQQSLLEQANKESGSFRKKYGWNARVIIDDKPTQKEIDDYALFASMELEDEWTQWTDL